MGDDDKKHKDALAVEQTGEEDESGTNASLESDDNALDAAQSAGLYTKADEEHPAELGIAKEVEKAEKIHREED